MKTDSASLELNWQFVHKCYNLCDEEKVERTKNGEINDKTLSLLMQIRRTEGV